MDSFYWIVCLAFIASANILPIHARYAHSAPLSSYSSSYPIVVNPNSGGGSNTGLNGLMPILLLQLLEGGGLFGGGSNSCCDCCHHHPHHHHHCPPHHCPHHHHSSC